MKAGNWRYFNNGKKVNYGCVFCELSELWLEVFETRSTLTLPRETKMSTWEKGRATRNNTNPPTTSQPLPTHTRTLARSRGIQLASSRASPSLPPVGGGAACGSRDSDICPVSRGKGGTGWLSLSLSVCVQARGLPPCLLRRCGVVCARVGRARLGRLPRRGAGPAERRGRRRPRSKGGKGDKIPTRAGPDRYRAGTRHTFFPCPRCRNC